MHEQFISTAELTLPPKVTKARISELSLIFCEHITAINTEHFLFHMVLFLLPPVFFYPLFGENEKDMNSSSL